MESNSIETINSRLFHLDEQYKASSNLIRYIDEAQDFYNGDQYPNANYRNMVRVTMNICSFSSNIKASKVVGTPIYITFTADDCKSDCTKLQRWDEYNLGKLNEKTENFQSALNGFNNGTEIIYYRWDLDDTTYRGIYKGGLAMEHIDPRNFAVANPYIQEIQNQKWIMFWKDEEVAAIRDMVEGDSEEEIAKKKANIVPDGYDDTKNGKDVVNHQLVRVYSRFFKIRGEVYFMCSTDHVDLFKLPHSINPKANKALAERAVKALDEKKKNGTDEEQVPDYGIDYEDVVMQLTDPEKYGEEEYSKDKERFYIYPFAVFTPFAINRSFYGRSDVKQIIPIQKGINFGMSMNLMCAQNNAYNKIFAKQGALAGQEITNEPGQVITDYSKYTNGWGIKMAESQPMPNGLSDFTNSMLTMARVVYGFNDVMDGSITNKDVSGYAIQQMIKQANSSIEQQQQLFWKFCKDKAAIRLMFYKFFVDSAKFTYELEDCEVDDQEQSRKALKGRQMQLESQGKSLEIGKGINLDDETRKTKIENFSKDDVYGTNFDIGIDVMQGLADSKLAESQMWDTLIMNGGIQNLEPEMLELYLEANPLISERTKNTLKSVVARQKRSENAKLKSEVQSLAQEGSQLAQYAKQLEAKNGYQSEYTKNLTNEFTSKINVANKVIQTLMNKNKQTVQGQTGSGEESSSEGQVKSDNARGMAGGSAAASAVATV